jgi:hypothetical protein
MAKKKRIRVKPTPRNLKKFRNTAKRIKKLNLKLGGFRGGVRL